MPRKRTSTKPHARTKQDAQRDTAPEEAAPGARAFWSGTLSFGLVTIPVELHTATRSTRRSLRMLAPDGTPLSRRYFSAEGKPLDSAELTRGYEVDKEQFVVVEDEELERLLPEQSRDINLTRFVPEDSIPPLFYDRAYILAPARGVSSAYRLLATTMEQLGKVGIATFVMRERQYVVAISARDGVLRAETLRFADELRRPDEIGVDSLREPPAESVRSMRAAIKKLSKARIAASELKDSYWQRVEKLVEKKKAEHKDVVPVPSGAEAEGEGEGAEIIDLMALLQQSLAKSKPDNSQARPGVKKTRAARKGTRRKAG